MPLVRLKAPQLDSEFLPEPPFHQLLIREAGMDKGDAEAAAYRLSRGKFVDIPFDFGEDETARAFVRNVKALGLEATLFPNAPLSWTGSRPRPWFLRLSLAVFISTGICLWSWIKHPTAAVTLAWKVVAGIIFVAWFAYGVFGAERPKTQEQLDQELKFRLRWKFGLLALVVLIATIVSAPVVGFVLLAIALVGIGFAFLIRMMNRN